MATSTEERLGECASWDVAWRLGEVQALPPALATGQDRGRPRSETAPVTLLIPPVPSAGKGASPTLELDKHTTAELTSRRLLLAESGQYALVVSIPRLENKDIFEKWKYKLGLSKSKHRFRVHVQVLVETARGAPAETVVQLSGPGGAGAEGEASGLWCNPEHNCCCARFVLSPLDVPATVSFELDSHTAVFKLRLKAELRRSALHGAAAGAAPAPPPPPAPAAARGLPPLRTSGTWFVEAGEPRRRVLLRGVNCSADCKLPTSPSGATHLPQKWSASQGVTFVGRPFPLDEAHEHLGRLERWGFNVLRFLVTWEAIEHRGPGLYDEEYLDYVAEVVRIAGEHNLYVFIDPHQDVWSRATGGSGAPLWTFGVAGLDVDALEEAGAAFTMNAHPNPAKFPPMTWPQNYQRFACLHMFTLFFGGNDFAPGFLVEAPESEGGGEVPIQEFLQRHFIDSIFELAKRLEGMEHVIGFDSFNEPSCGLIGKRLDELPEPIIPPGPVLRPFDALVSAAYPRTVAYYKLLGASGKVVINPTSRSVWKSGQQDVWQQHGVWRMSVEASSGGGGGSGLSSPRAFSPSNLRQSVRPYVRAFRL